MYSGCLKNVLWFYHGMFLQEFEKENSRYVKPANTGDLRVLG